MVRLQTSQSQWHMTEKQHSSNRKFAMKLKEKHRKRIGMVQII